jgi:intein/homing endonuclease
MSVPSVEVIIKNLYNDDPTIFYQLSDEERSLVESVFNEIQLYGKSDLLSDLWFNDFECKPVDIDTFISDDYYMGKIGKDIYPKWIKELRIICDPTREISEYVIRGSVGSGKTTIAVLVLLYKIYYLCCLKDPQRFYGLMEKSPIVFGLFNIYKYLAQDTSYKYFVNWVKLSPFFQDIMRRAFADERRIPSWLQRLNKMYGVGNEEMANSYMRFPKEITIALGSGAIHALGQNLFGGLCFSGNTKIPLLDGTIKTIKYLAENGPEKLWVYSIDPKSKRIIPGLACRPILTRINHKVLKVNLSNGRCVTCTPDHKFLLLNGKCVYAKNLKDYNFLMPFCRRVKKYEWLYNVEDHKWYLTHDLVARYKYGEHYRNLNNQINVIHHKSLNKRNNCPDQLQLMESKEHIAFHGRYARLCSEALKKKWSNRDRGAYLRGIVSNNGKKSLIAHNKNKRKNISFDDVVNALFFISEYLSNFKTKRGNLPIISKNMLCAYFSCSRSVIDRRLEEVGIKWRVLVSNFGNVRDDDRNRCDVNSKFVCGRDDYIPKYDYGIDLDYILKVFEADPFISSRSLADLLGCSVSKLFRFLNSEEILWEDLKEFYTGKRKNVIKIKKSRISFKNDEVNVYVKSIEEVDNCDTYCLSVDPCHTIGLDCGIFTFQCDEADMGRNSSISVDEKTHVEKLYGQAKSRLDSRFLQQGGVNPGILVLISQVTSKDSFLSKHVAKTALDPRTHVSQFAIWEIKEHTFPKDESRFQVVVGDDVHNKSFIVDEKSVIPEGALVIDVPESLRGRFEYDVEDAIRDQAGIPTYGVNLFIKHRDKVFDCYELATKRVHPFSVDSIELSIDTSDETDLIGIFKKDLCMNRRNRYSDIWSPKWYPGSLRAFHVDLAKNKDYAGIAMGCIGDYKRVQRFDSDGRVYYTTDVKIFIDFALRIKPRKGSEIDFSKIRSFIYFLHGIGFPIKFGSYDGYNSVDSQQQFKKYGFDVKELSVDKNEAPYHCLKSVLYETRLDMYEYAPFTDEVTKLVDNSLIKGAKPKIDHSHNGRKDVSDAITGVTFRLMSDKDTFSSLSGGDTWLTKSSNEKNHLAKLFR